MLIKQVIELIDILDSPSASGAAVEQYLRAIDPQANIEVYALPVSYTHLTLPTTREV